MSDIPVLEPAVVTAIEDYFRSLQPHASAEQMLADVLTSDFQTGFVGGHMWTGEQGLRDFLSARSVFFDESHELLQIFEVALEADGRVRARTRLRFFLRRLEPGAARSEEYTGDAFPSWLGSQSVLCRVECRCCTGLRSSAAKDGSNGQLPAVSGGSAQRAPSRFPTHVRKMRGPLPGRRLSHPCIFWCGEDSGRILVIRMSVCFW
jgi:hypothetical protein